MSWGRAAVLVTSLAALLGAVAALGPFRSTAEGDRVETAAQATRNRTVVRIVVAPAYDQEVIPSELEPLARYLEREVDVVVELTRAQSYQGAVEAVVSGEALVGVLPPLAWVQASELRPGIKLLALQSFEASCTMDAVLVVRRGEDLDEPEDLRGRPVCLVDPLSASGNLLARGWVRSHGLDPATFVGQVTWSGGHLQALRDLLDGRCDVAAVSAAALRVGATRGIDMGRLAVTATTGHVPVAAWAGAPQLEDRLASALTTALTSFEPTGVNGEPWLGETLRIGRFRTGSRSSFRGVWVSAQLEGVLRR